MKRASFLFGFFITSDLCFVTLELKKNEKETKKTLFNVFFKMYLKRFTSSKSFATVYRPTLKWRGL